MRKAGYRFKIVVSDVHERQPRGLTEGRLVNHLALKKALWVARKHPEAVVLGADTLVFVDHKIIGKPRSSRHAEQILQTLSGRWQKVYTGVAVAWDGGKRRRVAAALSRVKFRKLSREEIKKASSKHMDKAGAYAVQKKSDNFVEEIRGDYDNVVGLPMRLVRKLLRLSGHTVSKAV
jgi:septum formation protein